MHATFPPEPSNGRARACKHAPYVTRQIEKAAKDAYHQAVAPYRKVCRKAGVECEYAGQRAALAKK